MDLIINHITDVSKGIFEAKDSITNNLVGAMTYSKAGAGRIIVDHTEVNELYKGQGIGKLLFDKMIAFARAESLKVIPLCPYVSSVFKKNQEYNDVL